MKKESINNQSVNYLSISPELKELQYLMPMSEEDRENLKNDIAESGEIRDAIKCYMNEEGEFLILGGLNRWEIAKELNIKIVPVQVYKGITKEYRELIINDNLNRRHLSIDDKKRIAAEFFKINPERSARAVAKAVGLSKNTAGKVKIDLLGSGQNDHPETKQSEKKPEIKVEEKSGNTLESKIVKQIDVYKSYIKQLNAKKKEIEKNEVQVKVYHVVISDLQKILNECK